MSRKHLYTIAPHGRFLEVLADRILDGTLLNGWTREGAFWLSDVTIVLPTRRARLTLAEIFATRLGGVTLLPDIRTFGGESAEEEPFLPPIDTPASLPVAKSLERRLTLSRLVKAFADRAEGFATPPNAAEIFWLADSLGELVDDLTIEGVPASKLKDLDVGDLAQNWQDILQFLQPALEGWPKHLAESGRTDAAVSRNERLQRQAATAPLLYGDRPVIAAGSTGSIPATAALLGAIGMLPRGAIVLPGLDTSLSAKQHEALLEGETMEGHPQYGLAKLLRALDAGIAEVEELADAAPRTSLIRAAMAPADDTRGWAEARAGIPVAEALTGVSVIAAPTADLEARAIALAARQALVDRKSVGIVSRDQTLARRIAVELKRHGIEVDDPAGTPLFQSSAGRLARQILALAASDYGAVDTIALLSNAAVTLSMDRNDVRRLTRTLDLKLRGKRPGKSGLAGLREITAAEDGLEMLARLAAAMQPVSDLTGLTGITAAQLVSALEAAIAALIGDADIPGRAEFRIWSDDIAALDETGVSFPLVNLDAVLAALMAGEKMQSAERRRDDIHIWGELEARLQNPNLMILAGVNEDIWPAPADPGPWLSRKMRIDIGLEPPERRQGLAAHDFEMAMGNAEVIVAYASRIGASPALPSRFVQRLDAFIGEDEAKALRNRGDVWIEQARGIDFSGPPRPAARPAPRPPASARPRRLSITEIEPLMRSPYDIYARRVLKLERLEPIGSEPGPRERGIMIHEVFEDFIKSRHDIASPDAIKLMSEMAEHSFAGLDAISERRDIWLTRFKRAARLFLDYELERDPEIAQRVAEASGEMTLHTPETFILTGKADRIDVRRDGTVEIIDFKTGGVPESKDMKDFDAPQLLLEAAMVRAGAFAGIAPLPASQLTYIKIGLGPAAFVLKPFKVRDGMSLSEAADEILRRTQSHVETFLLRDTHAMAARIRPKVTTGRKQWPGNYDHLARTDEWTLTAGVDDP